MPKHSDVVYCTRCHGKLSKQNCVLNLGWCHKCAASVEVTMCKVPYWVVAAIGVVWNMSFLVTGALTDVRADVGPVTVARTIPHGLAESGPKPTRPATESALHHALMHRGPRAHVSSQSPLAGNSLSTENRSARESRAYLDSFMLASIGPGGYGWLSFDEIVTTQAVPLQAVGAIDEALQTPARSTEQLGTLDHKSQPPSELVTPPHRSQPVVSKLSRSLASDFAAARNAFSFGDRAYHAGRYLEAQGAFQHAVEHDTRNAFYYYVLAMTHYRLRQVEQAELVLSTAVRLEQESPIENRGSRLARYQGHPRVWVEQLRTAFQKRS